MIVTVGDLMEYLSQFEAEVQVVIDPDEVEEPTTPDRSYISLPVALDNIRSFK